MRAIDRSRLTGLTAVALALASSTAFACPADTDHSSRAAMLFSHTAPSSKTPVDSKISSPSDSATGKKGLLNDRLVRPHPRLDASAGVLG